MIINNVWNFYSDSPFKAITISDSRVISKLISSQILAHIHNYSYYIDTLQLEAEYLKLIADKDYIGFEARKSTEDKLIKPYDSLWLLVSSPEENLINIQTIESAHEILELEMKLIRSNETS